MKIKRIRRLCSHESVMSYNERYLIHTCIPLSAFNGSVDIFTLPHANSEAFPKKIRRTFEIVHHSRIAGAAHVMTQSSTNHSPAKCFALRVGATGARQISPTPHVARLRKLQHLIQRVVTMNHRSTQVDSALHAMFVCMVRDTHPRGPELHPPRDVATLLIRPTVAAHRRQHPILNLIRFNLIGVHFAVVIPGDVHAHEKKRAGLLSLLLETKSIARSVIYGIPIRRRPRRLISAKPGSPSSHRCGILLRWKRRNEEAKPSVRDRLGMDGDCDGGGVAIVPVDLNVSRTRRRQLSTKSAELTQLSIRRL